MGRIPRDEESGAIHHAIAKGSGGESIVRDDIDRAALLRRLGSATVRHGWLCLAYCLLDTHVHLVVATPTANLGAGMQWLLSRYAHEFNKRHEREGNLFHTRFYSTRVESEEHLSSALTYVHLNPVRAGIVDKAERWPWSSYPAALGVAPAPDFLAVDAVLELTGGRRESARLKLELAVNEALAHDRRGRGVRHSV